MNQYRLNKRQSLVKATKKPLFSNMVFSPRRDLNYVDYDLTKKEEFEDFFDFELELSSIKPAREIAQEVGSNIIEEPNHGSVILEDIKPMEFANKTPKGTILAPDNVPNALNLREDKCQAITDKGFQCSQRRPEIGDFCISHRRKYTVPAARY